MNILHDLQKPFPPEAITWKPGHATKDGTKVMAMAYGDLRTYMSRLDEVCGMDWSCRYVSWGEDRIMCELTIAGVTRTSTGEMSAQDEKSEIGGTVAEAQAFKRACAMFGLGRYLYDLPSVWVAYDSAAKKISKEGQNELDKRYHDWYRRTIAELDKKVAQRVVVADTGEIIHTLPSKVEVEEDGDVLFAKEPEQPTRVLASQAQRNKMHALGHDYYGERWNAKRAEWVHSATGGAYESSNDLSPEQIEWVIEKLQGRIAERAKKQQAQQPQPEAA